VPPSPRPHHQPGRRRQRWPVQQAAQEAPARLQLPPAAEGGAQRRVGRLRGDVPPPRARPWRQRRLLGLGFFMSMFLNLYKYWPNMAKLSMNLLFL
jgi:hypothetical protein